MHWLECVWNFKHLSKFRTLKWGAHLRTEWVTVYSKLFYYSFSKIFNSKIHKVTTTVMLTMLAPPSSNSRALPASPALTGPAEGQVPVTRSPASSSASPRQSPHVTWAFHASPLFGDLSHLWMDDSNNKKERKKEKAGRPVGRTLR